MGVAEHLPITIVQYSYENREGKRLMCTPPSLLFMRQRRGENKNIFKGTGGDQRYSSIAKKRTHYSNSDSKLSSGNGGKRGPKARKAVC